MTQGPADEGNRLIWATRGRTWGFRFLRDGGLSDPLTVYEAAFAEIRDEPEGVCRVADKVAVRFVDPEGRRDASGRAIPHDFVLLGPCGDDIDSVEDGVRLIWPRVADEFGSIWEQPDPAAAD